MFDKLKHTFKQTAVYSLGNVSTKIIGLILLPIYTNPAYLSVDDYGVWATLDVTSQILIGILALNLPLAMLRWASAEKDAEKSKSIVFSTLIAVIAIAALSLLFMLPNAGFFSRTIFGNENYSGYFNLLFIYAAFGIYNGVPLNILRLKEKSVAYVVITSSKFAALLSLNIFFVVYQGEGVAGIIKGQLLGEILLTLVTLPYVFKSINFKADFDALREMLKYGLPLVFSSAFTFILTFGDRYVQLHFLNEAKVGIYSLGYKIASVMNMLVLQSFQLGFVPIAYKKLGDKDDKRFFSKILTYYAIVLTFVALAISLFGGEIVTLLAKSEEYYAAAYVIPVIALAFVLKGVQYNFALSFHYAKKTIYNAAVVIVTAIVSLTLNIILVQRFDFIGSAYAMLISVFVMAVLSYVLSKKVYPIPFELGKIFKTISAGVSLFALSLIVAELGTLARISAKLILLLAFLPALYSVGTFEQVEIERAKEFLTGKNRGISD